MKKKEEIKYEHDIGPYTWGYDGGSVPHGGTRWYVAFVPENSVNGRGTKYLRRTGELRDSCGTPGFYDTELEAQRALTKYLGLSPKLDDSLFEI